MSGISVYHCLAFPWGQFLPCLYVSSGGCLGLQNKLTGEAQEHSRSCGLQAAQEAPPGAMAHHSMLAGQKQWQGSGRNPRDLGAGLYPLSQQGRLSGKKTGLFFKEPHRPLALGGLDVSSSPNGPWRRLGATQVMLGEVYSRKAPAYKLSGSQSGL